MRYIKSNEELGRNIKRARESKNLTQQNIADILNVKRSTVSYYESGRALPTVFQIIKLSVHLKIKLIYFLTVNKYNPSF